MKQTGRGRKIESSIETFQYQFHIFGFFFSLSHLCWYDLISGFVWLSFSSHLTSHHSLLLFIFIFFRFSHLKPKKRSFVNIRSISMFDKIYGKKMKLHTLFTSQVNDTNSGFLYTWIITPTQSPFMKHQGIDQKKITI